MTVVVSFLAAYAQSAFVLFSHFKLFIVVVAVKYYLHSTLNLNSWDFVYKLSQLVRISRKVGGDKYRAISDRNLLEAPKYSKLRRKFKLFPIEVVARQNLKS